MRGTMIQRCARIIMGSSVAATAAWLLLSAAPGLGPGRHDDGVCDARGCGECPGHWRAGCGTDGGHARGPSSPSCCAARGRKRSTSTVSGSWSWRSGPRRFARTVRIVPPSRSGSWPGRCRCRWCATPRAGVQRCRGCRDRPRPRGRAQRAEGHRGPAGLCGRASLYAQEDHDGDDALEYAQRIGSSPGTRDGLYWPAEPGQEPSPFGPFLAAAGVNVENRQSDAPYYGYHFRIMPRQGEDVPGGAYDYVINGNMIAGFAMVAWPAQYGDTGMMTFVVNERGVVHEKDLGPDTDAIGPENAHLQPGCELGRGRRLRAVPVAAFDRARLARGSGYRRPWPEPTEVDLERPSTRGGAIQAGAAVAATRSAAGVRPWHADATVHVSGSGRRGLGAVPGAAATCSPVSWVSGQPWQWSASVPSC